METSQGDSPSGESPSEKHMHISQNNSEKSNNLIEDSNLDNGNRYKSTDLPPYSIYLESIDKNIGYMKDLVIGKKLFDSGIEGINKVEKRGRNRIEVEFNYYKKANDFIISEYIKANNWRAYIPAHRVSCRGIIREIDISMSDETLMKYLKTENEREVLRVRRLKRKRIDEDGNITYVDSATVVVTFDGVRLPRHVSLFHVYRIPELYIAPVIQCYKCCRYGHTKMLCKAQVRCPRCSEGHDLSVCTSEQMVCCHCKQNHYSTEVGTPLSERCCPEYKRQKEVKRLMATHSYSAYEAHMLTTNPAVTPRINSKFDTSKPPVAFLPKFIKFDDKERLIEPKRSSKYVFKRPNCVLKVILDSAK
nr:uncharacterized protein LOC111422236 [Onthophagus taurus]